MSALIVVSGPSGVGKGTILKKVLMPPSELVIGESWTTREPRPGDEGGVKVYRYVTRAEFMAAVQRGEFLEWAEFSGNLYGTRRPSGARSTILEIEVQGAQMVWMDNPDAIMIGVLPPDGTAEGNDIDAMMKVCEERLRRRRSEDEAGIQRRLATARSEIAVILERWPHRIINNDADEAAQHMQHLIRVLSHHR